MNMVWAALLGLVFGAGQCWLLILGVRSLGSERLKVWAFVVQFFCPMAGAAAVRGSTAGGAGCLWNRHGSGADLRRRG